MLSTLQDLFARLTSAPNESREDHEHTLQLAAAVLLVEVMRADPDIVAGERKAVIDGLRSRFALADDELARLVDLAESKVKGANDYFSFTSLINDRFTQPEKIALVEAMWQVAYADEHLDAHENHVINKVAGLLHVTHGEYIAAKMRAKESAQLD